MERVRAHVEGCLSCRSELQRINADLGILALSVKEEVPPPVVRQRLLSEISSTSSTGARKRTGPAWAWKLAATVAGLLFVLSTLLLIQNTQRRISLENTNRSLEAQIRKLQDETREAREINEVLRSPESIRVTLTPLNATPQPAVQAVFFKERRRIFVVASHLPTLPLNNVYQLWIMPESGNPISAGIFTTNIKGDAQVLLPEIDSGTNLKGFALTREPGRGSPQPTSKPILAGNIV